MCGRGAINVGHPGNQWFRRIIASNRDYYNACPKYNKLEFAKAIVQAVEQQSGRFLERDLNSGMWHEIPFKRAVAKTSQGLREKRDDKVGIDDDDSPEKALIAEQETSPTSPADDSTGKVVGTDEQKSSTLLDSVVTDQYTIGNQNRTESPACGSVSSQGSHEYDELRSDVVVAVAPRVPYPPLDAATASTMAKYAANSRLFRGLSSLFAGTDKPNE